MQTFRHLSYLYRQKSVPHVVGRLRCSPKLSPLIRLQGSQYRSRHDHFGPHKEYFQTPGKEPKPDLSPYVRESQSHLHGQPQSQTSLSASNSNQNKVFPEQNIRAKHGYWTRIPRVIRSAIWFFTFLQLGAATGIALITWEYLSPPFESGSPEEQELVEEILDTLEAHPLVQSLREAEWIEVAAFTPDLQHGTKGRNMLHQVLGANNTQGIFMKVFHHPKQEFTMMVFFFGFGVEGWPDVIHGGIISTLLQEGLTKHLGYYYPDDYTTADYSASIDFRKPCKPGDIYGVVVAPSGTKSVTTGNVHLTKLQLTSLLVQLEGAPVVDTQYDPRTNTEVNSIGVPSHKGHDPMHVICRAEVKLLPKKINPDGSNLQIGSNEDGGFARALDYLKSVPGFKGNPAQTPKEEDKEED